MATAPAPASVVEIRCARCHAPVHPLKGPLCRSCTSARVGRRTFQTMRAEHGAHARAESVKQRVARAGMLRVLEQFLTKGKGRP